MKKKKDLFPCPPGFAHDIESDDCVPCGDHDGSFVPYEEVKDDEPLDPLGMFKKYGVKEIQMGKNTYKL